MQKEHDHIDKILPFGELIRGFANQSYISKAELKKALRDRGIFMPDADKDKTVPCICTLLLSPKEFDNLREAQNTREDNMKKSSSRIDWDASKSLIEYIPRFSNINEDLKLFQTNYELTQEPSFTLDGDSKLIIDFEIERRDLNKSWYESKNVFSGNLMIERIADAEIQITRSYTSSETEEVATKIQSFVIQHYKAHSCISNDKKLDEILFGNFSNEHRVFFFWRLTTHIDNLHFNFKDIEDVEFAPDESLQLPDEINWMYNKRELILKGTDVHNTSFIKGREYYKFLKLWSLEAKFDFSYLNYKGTCTALFTFDNYINKGAKAEFQVTFSNFSIHNSTAISPKSKLNVKQCLLDILEDQKNKIYKDFLAKVVNA